MHIDHGDIVCPTSCTRARKTTIHKHEHVVDVGVRKDRSLCSHILQHHNNMSITTPKWQQKTKTQCKLGAKQNRRTSDSTALYGPSPTATSTYVSRDLSLEKTEGNTMLVHCKSDTCMLW